MWGTPTTLIPKNTQAPHAFQPPELLFLRALMRLANTSTRGVLRPPCRLRWMASRCLSSLAGFLCSAQTCAHERYCLGVICCKACFQERKLQLGAHLHS